MPVRPRTGELARWKEVIGGCFKSTPLHPDYWLATSCVRATQRTALS
jgi:hypothetical protein